MKAGVLFAAALLVSLAPSFAAEVVAPPVRNVTPPGFTPGPEVDGPLVRVPVPPSPPPPPRWRRFFLPATADAGTFVVKGLTIHVAGVTPLAADATCTPADGNTWPCGKTALFSLRRFLHGRAVECFIGDAGAGDVTAPCRVGSTDLAAWLLRYGWAEAGDRPDEAAVAAVTVARCARLGIWRGMPPPAAETCRRQPHLN